jgi:hypothetical protein
VLNKAPQNPGIPVDAWKDKSEKHYSNIPDRAANRDGDEQDSK